MNEIGVDNGSLKPCPFCGGESLTLDRSWINNARSGDICVKCHKCGVEVIFHWKSTPRTAIELWNRRANDGKT